MKHKVEITEKQFNDLGFELMEFTTNQTRIDKQEYTTKLYTKTKGLRDKRLGVWYTAYSDTNYFVADIIVREKNMKPGLASSRVISSIVLNNVNDLIFILTHSNQCIAHYKHETLPQMIRHLG